MLTIGSLFSGIGGLELGLEWAGLGPTLWQVEIDPKARLVLAEHWPEAERFEDVRTVGAANLVPVDLICGGFPCQDTSSAGKRAGLAGARSGLWFEYHRIVSELLPSWVVVENPTSGASRWFDTVVAGLEQLGYSCLPVPIAASDVGACHRRARVLIVAANASCGGRSTRRPELQQPPRREAQSEAAPSSAPFADAHSESVRQQLGRSGSGSRAPESIATAADVDHDASDVRTETRSGDAHARRHSGWAAEPDVARVVHGLPGRVDRERLLGNAVVPQCAEVVGWVIRELLGTEAA